MPPKKRSKPANNQLSPTRTTTLSPIQRLLQSCIDYFASWIYMCVHRAAEAEDCAISVTNTICRCESITRSHSVCLWMFVINALTLDPDAIQTIDGPIDIIIMLVHLYLQGLCPLPQGTNPTGNFLTDTLEAVSFRFFTEAGPIDVSMFEGDILPKWLFFIIKVGDEHHFLAILLHEPTGRYLILDAANPRQFQADPPPWHIFLQTVSTGFWVYSPNLLTTVHARDLHGFAFPVTGGRLSSGVLPHCQTPLQLQNITAFPIQDPSHTWIGQVPYNVRYLNVSDDNVFTVLRIEDDPTVTHDD
eukprot:scaffold184706_cov76-Cyclotella_meneghiniana.AAC.2